MYWNKTSKISNIREFNAHVSQIVFSDDLIVLRLVPTVSDKPSQLSYLYELSAEVSQIVF